jgi:hypothetical protein
MHYLVLLVVPIALYRPRLSVAWVVPLGYWYLQGQENDGSAGDIAVMLALTAVALGLAMWRAREQAPVPALSAP